MPRKTVTPKEKKPKKERVPKTRNAGTMTESAYWGMIISGLRKKSMYWKPIQIAKQAARREYIGVNIRQKWEYQCNYCKKWFMDKETVIDHIIPVGSLKCGADLEGYVERMFCEEGFQCLCKPCHNAKTKLDIQQIRNPDGTN